MEKIKVLIADDHKIVRVGLRGILEREPDIDVIGEAEDGDEVLEFINSHVTDVILMDIDMRHTSGIETTRKVKDLHPDIRILALTVHEEHDSIMKMLQAGASGYLLKNVGTKELIAAIQAIVAGNSYFSNEVSATLLQAITSMKPKPSHHTDTPLTDREIEILRLIAQEYSNAEIAEKLFISVRTVDTHRRNILEKLQVKNTAGMVRYAIEKALV